MSDVCDGWCYQSDDDKGDEETQELAENVVERYKYAHPPFWQHISYQYPHHDSDDYTRQQS
jgi:hypothetical protein